MSVIKTKTFEWDDRNLQKIYDALGDKQQSKFHAEAMKRTATKIASTARQSAKAAGLGRTGVASKNGWNWIRWGRIPAAVSVGKLWKKGTAQNIRIFNRGNKRYGFTKSAPHAHLIILGHFVYIPQKAKDGGKPKMVLRRRKRAIPFYRKAYQSAPATYRKELEASVARLVAKLNKDGKV